MTVAMSQEQALITLTSPSRLDKFIPSLILKANSNLHLLDGINVPSCVILLVRSFILGKSMQLYAAFAFLADQDPLKFIASDPKNDRLSFRNKTCSPVLL